MDSMFNKIRFLVFPVIFIYLSFYSANNHLKVIKILPQLFFTGHSNKTLASELPPIPTTMEKTWKLAKLYYTYHQLKNKNETEHKKEMENILTLIADMDERPAGSITEEKLNKIYNTISDSEKEVSTLSKIRGFFSFVNLMWFLGTIGIIVTIGPCLVVIIAPLASSFAALAQLIYQGIIMPCHILPIFEIGGYLLCFQFIVEGFRYNIESGFFIALLGILGSLAASYYSFIKSFERHNSPSDNDLLLYWFVQCGMLVPFSYYYESLLLSWAATIIFYTVIGFSFIPVGMGYYIGFRKDDTIFRSVITSMIVGIVFIILKMAKVSGKIIQVYQQPLTVFSSVVMFLGLLLYCSDHYYYRRQNERWYSLSYLFRQIIFLVFDLGYLYFGFVYGLEGLKNTALTYLVFFLTEKFLELCVYFKIDFSIITLAVSILMYYCSLYLHSNKDFIVSIFA